MTKDFESILKACEDLEYLNNFAGCLRESEYRILLILCGHTKHGKVPLCMAKPILDEYWHTHNHESHLKNIAHILNVAISKIHSEKVFRAFNANS